jgi:hypothetical protein
VSARSEKELAYYRDHLARMKVDPYKAPEVLEEAREWLAQAECNHTACTCDSEDVPFCSVHVAEDEQ